MEGVHKTQGRVLSARSYCHLQYSDFFPLKQNQNTSKSQAFLVANDNVIFQFTENDMLKHWGGGRSGGEK